MVGLVIYLLTVVVMDGGAFAAILFGAWFLTRAWRREVADERARYDEPC